MTLEPPSDVPDFLVEHLAELPPETLRPVGEYARGETYVLPEGAPDNLVESFALQDDEVLEAIGEFTEEAAAVLEDEDVDSLEELLKDDEDEEKWGHNRLAEWHGL